MIILEHANPENSRTCEAMESKINLIISARSIAKIEYTIVKVLLSRIFTLVITLSKNN